MTVEQKPTNRFMTLGLPRIATKADEAETPIPAITPMKTTPVKWQPPKVAVAEDLPNDATERYLAATKAARSKAG